VIFGDKIPIEFGFLENSKSFWYWCALLGSNLLVRGRIVCCYVIPKFVNYHLCKTCLVGYTIIGLGLLDKYKIVAS